MGWYKFDPETNTCRMVEDDGNNIITINKDIYAKMVHQTELTKECIGEIVDAVSKKMDKNTGLHKPRLE